MRNPARLGILICAGSAFLLTSCGGGGGDTLGRLPVSGTVTYKGQPLAQGSIEFFPAQGVKTQGGAVIHNGKYSIPAEKGLAPGTYGIKISSTEGGSSGSTDEMPGDPKPTKELVPEKFNAKSTLKREISKGKTVIDFNLD